MLQRADLHDVTQLTSPANGTINRRSDYSYTTCKTSYILGEAGSLHMQPCQLSTPGRFSTSSLTTKALQLDEKHDWALQFVQLTQRQHLRSNDPEAKATSITSSSRPSIFSCYRGFKFKILAFAQTSSSAVPLYGHCWIRHPNLRCWYGKRRKPFLQFW